MSRFPMHADRLLPSEKDIHNEIKKTTPFQINNCNVTGTLENYEFDKGCQVRVVVLNTKRDFAIDFASFRNEDCVISGNYLLHGTMFTRLPNGTEFELTPKKANLVKSPPSRSHFQFSKGQQIHLFTYSLSESYLSRCLGEQVPASLAPFLDVKELNYQLLEFCPTADMRQLIEKVFACQFNGALRMLFIEGAMLQLIALKAKLFIEGETLAELNALPDWEAAQIKAAYKMLVSDLTCPPTLSELSCKVNLGERRLNEGFKKLFGDSAFGILRNERLESARRALERGDVPLKQISYRVGYRHTNNFIQAFTKYFGISPTKYKRSLNLDTPDG